MNLFKIDAERESDGGIEIGHGDGLVSHSLGGLN
ncbi:MAG: hypothetical protein ACI8UO_003006 [Verrucomicrobiales bacterium]|jgi:hypothetical protein